MRFVMDNLTEAGRELVLSNPEMFESEFTDGVDRRLSRSEMIEMIHGTFDSAADMEIDYGDPVVSGGSLDAYKVFAAYGWDAYVNGGLSQQDAEALVRDNYPVSGNGPKASGNRSSRSVKASGKTKSAKGRGSCNTKPKSKATDQPRRANGQFAEKPRSRTSTNRKGVRR